MMTHANLLHCDNVGGLAEHTTCHMFWFIIHTC